MFRLIDGIALYGTKDCPFPSFFSLKDSEWLYGVVLSGPDEDTVRTRSSQTNVQSSYELAETEVTVMRFAVV